MKFLSEQDKVKNTDEFQNDCIPMHWNILELEAAARSSKTYLAKDGGGRSALI